MRLRVAAFCIAAASVVLPSMANADSIAIVINSGATTETALFPGIPGTANGIVSTPAAGPGSIPNWTVNQVTGSVSSSPAGVNFGSTSLDVSSNSVQSTLNVYVTAYDLNAPLGNLGFLSSFTSNTLPAGWSVTEQTWLSTANGIGTSGLGTLLGSTTFGAIGTLQQFLAANVITGPYSLTEQYTITTPVGGCTGVNCSAQSTINVAAAPGPILGAGLPGLLAACGGLIAMARRRRRNLT